MYLAAAGVGTIGIVDFDAVDSSNLQRQIIHGTTDVGRSKLESARARLSGLNPNVRIEGHETALTSKNALDILRDYDIVVDGTDNFPTRYLVNDACVILQKPNACGSIFRFEGQASVFATKGGPCYRCLYRSLPRRASCRAARKGASRCAARRHRHNPGDRSDQADPRRRRTAGRPLPHLRRAAHALPS